MHHFRLKMKHCLHAVPIFWLETDYLFLMPGAVQIYMMVKYSDLTLMLLALPIHVSFSTFDLISRAHQYKRLIKVVWKSIFSQWVFCRLQSFCLLHIVVRS